MAAGPAERGQNIGAAGLQQGILGQGARRDETHHIAAHHRLGTALFRLCRVLHLLADRHPEALADQFFQILLGGMDRHAAHRNIFTQMLAALGQRDVERRSRPGCVIEEQFIEVAHPVKQQIAVILGLNLEILGHQRRDGIVSRRWGRRRCGPCRCGGAGKVFVHDPILSDRLRPAALAPLKGEWSKTDSPQHCFNRFD